MKIYLNTILNLVFYVLNYLHGGIGLNLFFTRNKVKHHEHTTFQYSYVYEKENSRCARKKMALNVASVVADASAVGKLVTVKVIAARLYFSTTTMTLKFTERTCTMYNVPTVYTVYSIVFRITHYKYS